MTRLPGRSEEETEQEPDNDNDKEEEEAAWTILGGNIATCLLASDLKRDSGFDGSSTGWTSWVDEQSAFRLQQCIDRLRFCGDDTVVPPSTPGTQHATRVVPGQQQHHHSDREDTVRWLHWMQRSPAPMILELSNELRAAVTMEITATDLQRIQQSRTEFLNRIGCRLILLPSGGTLARNLREEPGAMVYGKLCFGGVTRYRLLGGGGGGGAGRRTTRRKAGERTLLAPSVRPSNNLNNNNNTSAHESVAGWLQYGGPERNYEAVDMGPCGLIEITILPKGLELGLFRGRPAVPEHNDRTTAAHVTTTQVTEEMLVTHATAFDPRGFFSLPSGSATKESGTNHVPTTTPTNTTATITTTTTTSNETESSIHVQSSSSSWVENSAIETQFSTVLGGLQTEIQAIIRRVLDGRQTSNDAAATPTSDYQLMLDLGLSPVRGVLLYGKPGCGKTALAREISRLLTDRPVKIVAAPELLDRWVGGTESSVRALFSEAEAELLACGGNPALSGLHVIIIDEIDAVFRKRSSSSGSGEVARASAVNQILSKLDGVKAAGNILVIGTTNRRELLDEALLRPGRLEVKIEIPLPDQEGRREILKIYFGPLRSKLSKPLCQAIDGHGGLSTQSHRSENGWLFRIPRILRRARPLTTLHDLASETKGFSGADIAGLVRCAGSIALSRARNEGSDIDGLLVTTEDVMQALREVKQEKI